MALEKGGYKGVFQELFTRKEGERRRRGLLVYCYNVIVP